MTDLRTDLTQLPTQTLVSQATDAGGLTQHMEAVRRLDERKQAQINAQAQELEYKQHLLDKALQEIKVLNTTIAELRMGVGVIVEIEGHRYTLQHDVPAEVHTPLLNPPSLLMNGTTGYVTFTDDDFLKDQPKAKSEFDGSFILDK